LNSSDKEKGGIAQLNKLVTKNDKYSALRGTINSETIKSGKSLQAALDKIKNDPALTKLLSEAETDVVSNGYLNPALSLGKKYGLHVEDRGVQELLLAGALPNPSLLKDALDIANSNAKGDLANKDATSQITYILGAMSTLKATGSNVHGYTQDRINTMTGALKYVNNKSSTQDAAPVPQSPTPTGKSQKQAEIDAQSTANAAQLNVAGISDGTSVQGVPQPESPTPVTSGDKRADLTSVLIAKADTQAQSPIIVASGGSPAPTPAPQKDAAAPSNTRNNENSFTNYLSSRFSTIPNMV
jgi:hypothetical protein